MSVVKKKGQQRHKRPSLPSVVQVEVGKGVVFDLAYPIWVAWAAQEPPRP
jgi:hypothetical protein